MFELTRGGGIIDNFLVKKRANAVERLIPNKLRKGRILDLGCGRIPFFLINTKFKEKYGVDPSLKRIDSQNMILKKFFLDHKTKLPFKNNFFDVIIMLAVFEHIEPNHLTDILKEIKRILKPNGIFILTTPCPWIDWLNKLMSKLRMTSTIEAQEHKGVYNKSLIFNYFSKAGFKKDKMNFGYFGMFLNSWAYVYK